MKHFGRSLLNPTNAAARRDFALGPLLDDAAEPADFELRGDGAMRQAFRKAKAARDDRRREERAGGRRHDGRR